MNTHFVIMQIQSKNKRSFESIVPVLTTIMNCLKLTNRSDSAKFTILNSPHVHKTAQQKFKIQTYNKLMVCALFDLKTILLIKRLFTNLFHDLKFNYLFLLALNNSPCSLANFRVMFYVNPNKFSVVNYLKLLNLIGD